MSLWELLDQLHSLLHIVKYLVNRFLLDHTVQIKFQYYNKGKFHSSYFLNFKTSIFKHTSKPLQKMHPSGIFSLQFFTNDFSHDALHFCPLKHFDPTGQREMEKGGISGFVIFCSQQLTIS
jgi:hypothetical protein